MAKRKVEVRLPPLCNDVYQVLPTGQEIQAKDGHRREVLRAQIRTFDFSESVGKRARQSQRQSAPAKETSTDASASSLHTTYRTAFHSMGLGIAELDAATHLLGMVREGNVLTGTHVSRPPLPPRQRAEVLLWNKHKKKEVLTKSAQRLREAVTKMRTAFSTVSRQYAGLQAISALWPLTLKGSGPATATFHVDCAPFPEARDIGVTCVLDLHFSDEHGICAPVPRPLLSQGLRLNARPAFPAVRAAWCDEWRDRSEARGPAETQRLLWAVQHALLDQLLFAMIRASCVAGLANTSKSGDSVLLSRVALQCTPTVFLGISLDSEDDAPPPTKNILHTGVLAQQHLSLLHMLQRKFDPTDPLHSAQSLPLAPIRSMYRHLIFQHDLDLLLTSIARFVHGMSYHWHFPLFSLMPTSSFSIELENVILGRAVIEDQRIVLLGQESKCIPDVPALRQALLQLFSENALSTLVTALPCLQLAAVRDHRALHLTVSRTAHDAITVTTNTSDRLRFDVHLCRDTRQRLFSLYWADLRVPSVTAKLAAFMVLLRSAARQLEGASA